MNFLSSTAFSVTASLIYKHKKTLFGGIIGLVASVFATTATMMLANLVITPFFMKTSTEQVIKLIPVLLLPFNFLKALTNAALVIGFYKPVSNALKAVGAVKRRGEEKLKFDKITIVLLALSAFIAAISIVVIFTVIK